MNRLVLEGTPNKKQEEFFMSTKRHIAYGGARGGGKSWAMRRKFVLLCLQYPGIQCLLLRRTLPELRENHQLPLQRELYGFVKYNSDEKSFVFPNGSRIRLGYCDTEGDVYQYQGQEYDVIGLEEATHFCVHPDTDVMTDSGWKNVSEVRTTDRVLSIDDDLVSEFKSVKNVFAFQHKGEMLTSKNNLDFSVTPRHKLFVENKGLVEIENINDNDKIISIGEPRHNTIIPTYYLEHSRLSSNEIKSVDMNVWLSFLGWYFSEGCAFRKNTGNTPKVTIRQMKHNQHLVDTLNSLGYKYSISKDGQYNIYSKQLYDVVKSYGKGMYDKRIPRWIFDLDASQIKYFIDAFVYGDGHIDKVGETTIGLCNKGLVDDLQELYSLCGVVTKQSYSKTKTGFNVYRLRTLKNKNKRISTLIKEQYEGDVWCLVVEDNHNFMTRFNGKTMITGNTESQKDFLLTCNRSTRTDIHPRMYYTSNPGNIGHAWFKRLFIDREYRNKERPEDYEFIQALVYDNDVLMSANPEYVESLENLPEDMKKAMLYGDWNVFEGQFFSEFDSTIHVIKPFKIPEDWRIYRTLDYGLDKCACYWIAQSADNHFYVVDELYESELIVSDASKKIKEMDDKWLERTNTNRKDIEVPIAPPDIWSRDGTTGKSAADLFYENGINWYKGNNDRINGWLSIKEMLKIVESKDIESGETIRDCQLKIFTTCTNLIRTLPQVQHDNLKPNDIAKNPHELTHAPDALRMFCMYWISGGDTTYVDKPSVKKIKWTSDMYEDYNNGSEYVKERMIELYGKPNK